MYFSRSCILAIHADHPAARKCKLTGSACPVCFTPETKMALAKQEPCYDQKRTNINMSQRKRVLIHMSKSNKKGANGSALKRAKRIGVNLHVEKNGWDDSDAPIHETVFGPSRTLDNVYQCMPQVKIVNTAHLLLCINPVS